MTKQPNLEGNKRLMGALVRMKPKPLEETKIGKKNKPKKKANARARKADDS